MANSRIQPTCYIHGAVPREEVVKILETSYCGRCLKKALYGMSVREVVWKETEEPDEPAKPEPAAGIKDGDQSGL